MQANASKHGCTFCDLIKGAAEVSICHEDSDAIAFMDIQPVNNGHVLVVPRAHYETIFEVPAELGQHIFKVTMSLASAVRKVTGCEDINIVVSSGEAAGQDELHYHVHIIPRRVGDGFDIPLPFNGSEMPDRTLLDAWAARIGSALRDPVKAGASHDGSQSSSKAHRDPVVRSKSSTRVETKPDSSPAVETPNDASVYLTSEEGPHGELRTEAERRRQKR